MSINLGLKRSRKQFTPVGLTPIGEMSSGTKTRHDQLKSKLGQNVRYNNLEQGYISGTQLKIMSWDDMKAATDRRYITSGEMTVAAGTVNDPMLGVLNPSEECPHCKERTCLGHCALIEFPKNAPVIHPLYIEQIITILHVVCGGCGELMIPKSLLENDGVLSMNPMKRLEYFKKFAKNSASKNVPTIKCTKNIDPETDAPCPTNYNYKVILHSEPKSKTSTKIIGYYINDKGKKKSTSTAQMNVVSIFKILDNISDEDAEILLGKNGGHPRDMILRGIIVPPNNIRRGTILEENKLSSILAKIAAESLLQQDTNSNRLKSLVDQVFLTSGDSTDRTSYLDLIQGKQGLIRSNIMGKHTECSARAPVGPDISLEYGQFGFPELYAKNLTIPITVTEYNIDKIRDKWESAGYISYITPKATRTRKEYVPGKTIIKPGDIIDRRLLDGDPIIVNRNPTLHRESLMGHSIKLVDGLQLKLHLSCTTPMNCDFDGDDNNCFIPQSIPSRLETMMILNCKKHIMGAENSKPNMGLVMNSITMSYLMSTNDTKITPGFFRQAIKKIEQSKKESFDLGKHVRPNVNQLDTLLYRLNAYGVDITTGQAVYSALFPPDFCYKKHDVLIINGVLLRGKLTKKIVGPSSDGIIQHLHKQYGYGRTAEFITAATWVCALYAQSQIFSVGIADMYIFEEDDDGKMVDICDIEVKQSLAKMRTELRALESEEYDKDDPIQSSIFENKVKDIVNVAESIGSKLAGIVLSDKSRLNTLGVMTDQGAGTKGSNANVGQIMGSVGQQQHNDERFKFNLTHGLRSLPCFDLNDKRPEAKGFVDKSFKDGINPVGLFNIQTGGRGPLLDTAMQTSETGALNRKMIKAFENTQVDYDYSMRNMVGSVIVALYNSGMDPRHVVSTSHGESFVNIAFEAMNINCQYGHADIEDMTITPLDNKVSWLKGDAYEPVPEEKYPPPTFTDYEYVKLIGTRAMQIEAGVPPLITTDMIDPIYIALEEYKQGLLSDFGVLNKYTDKSYDIKFAGNGEGIPNLEQIMEKRQEKVATPTIRITNGSSKSVRFTSGSNTINVNADEYAATPTPAASKPDIEDDDEDEEY